MIVHSFGTEETFVWWVVVRALLPTSTAQPSSLCMGEAVIREFRPRGRCEPCVCPEDLLLLVRPHGRVNAKRRIRRRDDPS